MMRMMVLLILIIALNTVSSVSRSQQMVMGGTVQDFLDELLFGELISQQQFSFILGEAEAVIFEGGHHAKDNIFRLDSDVRLISYIEGEVDLGRITRDTADYLSNLLNLGDQEQSMLGRPLSTNVLSVEAVSTPYTGNGNVEGLGRFEPEALSSSEIYNGIWGYAVGVREYALQCNSRGLHIIDVTDPGEAFLVQKISMSGGTIWRDVEVYGTYAYVAAQSNGNFFVVDLSNLSGTTPHQPNSNPITRYADRGYTNYGHTLSVGDGLLFLNTARGSFGCQIFDLEQDPWDPPLISSWSGAGNDCHDSFARSNVASRDLLFSADGYSGKYRLLDITNIRSVGSPIKIGETPSIGSVYAHFIYPSEDNKYLYAFDEANNFDIIVWDISDPSTPFQVSVIKWSGESTEGDAIVHNGQVRGNYLLTAYYEAGFRVFDISNPANAVEVGKYETYRDPDGDGSYERNIRTEYDGAWNLYSFLPSGNVLVSDQSSGTFIVRVNDVAAPVAPTGLSVVLLDGNSRARLEWSSSDRATGYTVKRSTTTGGPYTDIKTNNIGTTFVDDTLINTRSPAYYYVVTATNAGGASSSSNEVSITTSTPEPTSPPTPSTPEPTSPPTPSTPEPTSPPTPSTPEPTSPPTSSTPEPTSPPTPSENQKDLILSEILPNPKAVPDKFGEFVEIYNPDSTDIKLDETSYRLCSSTKNRCKKLTGEVLANGYYTFCRNSNQFPEKNVCNKNRLFGLNNKGDTISLQKMVNGSWETVDSVTYPKAQRNKGDRGYARNSIEPFCNCWHWSASGYTAGTGPF